MWNRAAPCRHVARFASAFLCVVVPHVTAAGTVFIGDQNRGVQWKFAGDGPFGSKNSPSSATPQPFDATVDEADAGDGDAFARVRATYASLLAADLSSADGALRVDRVGRPAAANATFVFEFGVNEGPVDLALALDAEYERLAGAADPLATTGSLRIRRIPVGAPPGTIGELVLNHEFELGAADDESESFRRGDGGGEALRLDPGPYALEFNIGLPEGPPDFSNWTVDGTSTDRSERVAFNVAARFTNAGNGGGGTAIPLPPAVLSGGTLLAALAAYGRLRHRRT